MKKFLAGFCAAAIAAGCMGMTVMADTEATDKLTSYEATSDNVKLIGRTYRKGDTTILGYSASGIEFKCTGTKAVFNVNGSVGEARIGVFVNGKLVKQGYIKNKKTNAVEVDLPEGESTVKLIKLSEAAQSVIAIDSFEVDGKPQPTEAAKHSQSPLRTLGSVHTEQPERGQQGYRSPHKAASFQKGPPSHGQ